MPIPGLESSIWVRAGPAGRTCAYGYGQSMCEKNAESEGVAARCRFQHGDVNKLDFPDGSFDTVVSNYVYHNVIGAAHRHGHGGLRLPLPGGHADAGQFPDAGGTERNTQEKSCVQRQKNLICAGSPVFTGGARRVASMFGRPCLLRMRNPACLDK